MDDLMEDIKKDVEEHAKKVGEQQELGFDENDQKDDAVKESEQKTDVDSSDSAEEQREDDVKDEGKKAEDNDDNPNVDLLEAFNKKFDASFESEDDIKKLLDISTEDVDSLKSSLKDKEEALAEKDKLIKDKYDVLSHFASEKQFKVNELLKSNEGMKDYVAARIVNSDFDNMSNEDVLVLQDMIDLQSDVREDLIREDVRDTYGLAVDKSSMDEDELKQQELREYRAQRAADKARSEFKKMVDGIEVPKYKDPSEARKEEEAKALEDFNNNKDGWKSYLSKEFGNIEKFPIEVAEGDKVEVEFGKDFRKEVVEKMPEVAAKMGYDLENKDHVDAIVADIKKNFVYQNINKILAKRDQMLKTKQKDEEYKKYHNPSNPNRKEKDADESNKSLDEQNQRILNSI